MEDGVEITWREFELGLLTLFDMESSLDGLSSCRKDKRQMSLATFFLQQFNSVLYYRNTKGQHKDD